MWVKGDAAASREYGLLPMAMLQGRVVAQVGMLSYLGLLLTSKEQQH
jgi:hypothetical protein